MRYKAKGWRWLALVAVLSWLVGCMQEPSSPKDVVDEPDVDAAVDVGSVEDVGLAEVKVDAGPDPTDGVFDPDRLLNVVITLDPKDWDELRYQSRSLIDIIGPDCLESPSTSPFTWFLADVSVDGVAFQNVGLRKKGLLGSLSDTRPSLKVVFDKYAKGQRFEGLERMTFNNARQDPSKVNQCITYLLMDLAGVPAPRCNYARLSVNGMDLGIYVHVESIKKDFIRRHFADDAGNLYEGTLSDFREGWTGTFQPKGDTPPGIEDIQDVIDALDVPDDELVAAISKVIDLDAFLTFWAMESMVGHWDGYSGNTNNFYIYKNPETQRLHFIPWGADATLFDQEGEGAGQLPKSVQTVGALSRRLYLHPSTRSMYVERMKNLTAVLWNESALIAEVDRMEALIKPHVLPWMLEWMEEGLSQKRAYINKRGNEILKELESPPTWAPPLREPPCFKPAGNIAGGFQTTWGTAAVENLFQTGTGTLDVDVPGFDETILQVGSKSGYGTEGDNKGMATFAVAGQLASGGYLFAFFVTAPELVVPEATIPIDWQKMRGYVYYAPPAGEGQLVGLLANGKIVFQKAGLKYGDPIEATFSGELFSP